MILKQFLLSLKQKYGEESSEYNLNLLFLRYSVVTQGIFVLPNHNLFSHGQLEHYFNQGNFIDPANDLLVDIIAGILAYTPWKTGFSHDFQVSSFPRIKAI